MSDKQEILNQIISLLVDAGFNSKDFLDVNNDANNTRLIKERDATQYLGISRNAFHNLIKSGAIKRIIIGPKIVRYDLQELNYFILDHRETNKSIA